MNDFLKDIINEAFKSKKQQRFFYAKANDESEPKKERQKWGEWAKEFANKTNFKKLPEVAETEGEIEEIVDDLGNISRSKIPTDAPTKGVTQKRTTDQVVKTAYNMMGAYGTQGTQGYTRYWGEGEITKGKLIEDIMGESDLEGTLGYEATLGQDASKEEAERYFKNELGMSDTETEERLAAMGYDDELPDEKVRLIENPKKYMGDYSESVLAKRNVDDDIVTKEGEITEINPIILKQIKSLKNSLNSNQITIKDLVKLLKDNE